MTTCLIQMAESLINTPSEPNRWGTGRVHSVLPHCRILPGLCPWTSAHFPSKGGKTGYFQHMEKWKLRQECQRLARNDTTEVLSSVHHFIRLFLSLLGFFLSHLTSHSRAGSPQCLPSRDLALRFDGGMRRGIFPFGRGVWKLGGSVFSAQQWGVSNHGFFFLPSNSVATYVDATVPQYL